MTNTAETLFLVELFRQLDISECRYAVLRNYKELPISLAGSDLDIVVNPLDLEKFISCIRTACSSCHGFVLGGGVRRSDFYQVFLAGKNDGNWWGVCIDIFSGVYFLGAAELVDYSSIKNNTFRHNDKLNVVSDELAAMLGVLKELLHNSDLPARYLPAATSAVRENWELVRTDMSLLGTDGLRHFHDLCLSQYDKTSIKKKAIQLRNSILWSAYKRAPIKYIRARFEYEWSKLYRFFNPPGGVVVILGTDGAGKSTLLEAIRPVIESATHSPVTIKHLRPGLMPALSRLKGEQPDKNIVTEPHAKAPGGMFSSLLRISWLLTDYIIGYWLIVRPKIAKSATLVFFDRYVYDIELDPRRFRISLPLNIIRLFTRLAPKPDLIICLYGSPDVIAARKKELPLAEVTRQVAALKAYAAKEPRAVLVCTEGSIEKARDQVLYAIAAQRSSRNQERAHSRYE